MLFYHNDRCELQLVLPDSEDRMPVDVSVMWAGNGINHPIDALVQQTNGMGCLRLIVLNVHYIAGSKLV